MAGKVPNSRKPRITIKPRELPSGITTATSARQSVPGGQPLKLPKDFELILQRCREMTAKYAGRYECITDAGVLQSYIDMAIRNGRMSIDTETTGLDVFQDYVVGFSLKTAGLKAGYVPLKHLSRMTGKVADGQLSVEVCAKILNQLPTSVNLKMANAQFDIFMLKNSVGVNYTNHEVDDVLLMGRILDTERKAGKRSLKDFHADLCEGTTRGPKFSELFKPGTFHMCPFTLGYTYAARDAEMTDEVADVLEALLAKEPPLQYVYQSIEKPLLPVLIKMRERGVMVDQSKRTELTKKYRQMLGDAIASFEAAYAPFIPAINQYMRSAAFAKPKGRIELPVKIGSDDQLKVLLWDIMKLPVSEGRKVDKGVLYGLNNDIANAILEYRRCTKLLSTYLEGIEKFIQKDGCVHGGIRQIGADTGRTSSCIAEGTLVDCPGESKPIEQIRVGDEVYTYDDAGNLCVRKVTGVMDNGYRQCMTLKWQSSGTQECGSLTCTPDHMIKTKDAGWVMADHLKPRQKVFHLRARETETERVLSGTNSLYCAEHHWLKFNYFMCEGSSLHIHHEDGNHKNNRLSNLIILDGHDHLSLHGNLNKDKECCRGIGKYLGKMTDAQKAKYRATRRQHDANYFNEHGYAYQGLPYTREAWLDMMDKVDWLPNKIPHDFLSVLKNLRMHRINYIDEYQKRAAEKHMRYKSLRLQPVHINYALELADGDAVVAAGFFGVSLDKFTAACERYNISYNHMILSASDAGICHVYDLEVEDTHCYIAGEICVHNCDPNMQNIPSRNRDIRQIYRARPGCVLISCDYSGQEPRLTASLCKDEAMIKTYKGGKDLYSMIAAVAFNVTYEECLEHNPDGSLNKEGKWRRGNAKTIVLGRHMPRSLVISC